MGIIGGLLSCSLLEIPLLNALGLWPKKKYSKIIFKLLTFLLGYLLNYLVLSLFLSQISLFFAKNTILLTLLLFFMGLLLLFWGVIIVFLDANLSFVKKVMSIFYPQNYLYIFFLGFLFVFIEIFICTNCRPILFVLSEIVLPTGNIFYILFTFLFYGFGRIIPILLISLFLLYLYEHLLFFKNQTPMRIFLGSLLIFEGLILIWLM